MSLATPVLHTARLRLRPFTDADADSLFALHSSTYVLRSWDSPAWTERARAERFIAMCRKTADEGTGARKREWRPSAAPTPALEEGLSSVLPAGLLSVRVGPRAPAWAGRGAAPVVDGLDAVFTRFLPPVV